MMKVDSERLQRVASKQEEWSTRGRSGAALRERTQGGPSQDYSLEVAPRSLKEHV